MAGALALTMTACGNMKKGSDATSAIPVGPAFLADSAYSYCEQQCQFGPRTMNSEAHELCGQ